MNSSIYYRLSLPLAVFGFMLIIATGFNMIIGDNSIPLVVSLIGLALIIISFFFRKKQ